MDTPIFEYLKTKRAVFEIRHYIIDSNKNVYNRGGKVRKINHSDGDESNRSDLTEEE